jgi:hypothetical protein
MDNTLFLSTVKYVSTLSCSVLRHITESDLASSNGRASQPVSCRFPTTAAGVDARSGHMGFVVDKVSLLVPLNAQ